MVCVLSRMCASQNTVHGKEQLMRTVQRCWMDAQTSAEISRQDTDPLVALLHNMEALAVARQAKRLADECLLKPPQDFTGLIADLRAEQDQHLRAV